MADVSVRPIAPPDRAAVDEIFTASWGRPFVVRHGVGFHLTTLPTLVAVDDAATVVGVLTYTVDNDALEMVSVEAVRPGGGVGGALLRAAIEHARRQRLRRVWLVTTNDNLDALRLYQRRGLRITRVLPGGVDQARRLKPSIPPIGGYDLPVHDELTLELRLDGVTDVRAAGRAAVLRHVFDGELDMWSLLADPVDAADAVRALAMPHLGRVDLVTGYGPVGITLAALVARELGIPMIPPHTRADQVTGRLLTVDAGVATKPTTNGLDESVPVAAIAVLVDQLPPVAEDAPDHLTVPVTALLDWTDLTG